MSPRLGLLAGLVAVAAAGLVVRAVPLALSDFPVNDGGLFMAMSQAISEAGWTVPPTVAWNGMELPFTYPPLGFYVAALLETLGLDPFDVFRWLPLLASTLVVPAVFLLGRALLRSDTGGLVAALAYALAPASYVWLIQGGGVTRSPGMLVAVLALWQLVVLVREPSRSRVVTVGLLSGLTALIHPGAAVFVAGSGALIWILKGRTRRSLAHAAGAVGIALLVVAPWALTVMSRHGVDGLLGVPSNGPDPVAAGLAVIAGRSTGQPFMDPLAVVGLAFAILLVIRRQLLLPLWFVAAVALSYQYAMVPFGLVIGAAAVELAGLHAKAVESASGSARWAPLMASGALAVCLLVEGVASAFTVTNPGAPVHALSPERREAMSWVSANPPGATFAVITDSAWSGDPDSEWFPMLSGQESVATVQGTEWLGRDAFEARVEAHRALQACVEPASLSCIEDWLAEWPADYLYLPKGRLHGPNSSVECCAALRSLLTADPDYRVRYDEAGATVVQVGDSAPPN